MESARISGVISESQSVPTENVESITQAKEDFCKKEGYAESEDRGLEKMKFSGRFCRIVRNERTKIC